MGSSRVRQLRSAHAAGSPGRLAALLANKLDEVPFKVFAIQLDNELHESSYMPFIQSTKRSAPNI
ncbi:hypothetical protein [Mesorhizobium sp. M0586]|uniref:hypothetical protein n=1 Tax=unclassified Mesorhizobium TaxID=325217 RepID=UPI003336D26B